VTNQLREREPSGVGWARLPAPQCTRRPGVVSISGWRYGRIFVLSSLNIMEMPDGRGDVGPQWHISVTRLAARPGPAQVLKALRLVVDPARRVACQCKADEQLVREPDGFTWSNPREPSACRGCELQRANGRPCPLHASAHAS